MKPIFPLANHAATLLFLPALVLTVLFGIAQGVRGDTVGYWVGIVSSATVFVVLSCTYASLAAALTAGRIRKAQVFKGATTRSPLTIASAGVWPPLVGAIILQAVGLAMASSHSWGAPGRIPVEILAAWIVMILFHTALGYLFGLLMPAVVAAPLAVIVSYVWLGFTWSVDYVPLRYLAGLALSGCCAVYADLPIEAPLTVILFSGGAVALLAAALALWNHRRRWLMFAGLASIMIPVTVSSIALASNLGYYPSPPRAANALVCAEQDGRSVCLFPEQLWNHQGTPTQVVFSALNQLEAQGISVPRRVSGAIVPPSADTVWMVYRSDFSNEMTLRSLVSSLVPQRQEGDVCVRDDEDPDRMFVITDVLRRELYRLASASDSAPDLGEMPTGADQIDAVTSYLNGLDEDQRASWVNDAVSALRDCEVAFPDTPPLVS